MFHWVRFSAAWQESFPHVGGDVSMADALEEIAN